MHSFIAKATFLIFFVGVFFGATFAQQGQSKEQLQQQQKQLQQEIDDLNATLNSIKKNKKQSLTQLAIVQRKIAKREQLVNNINREINHINDDIYNKEIEQYRLKKELDTLKQKYAQSIVFAYKNSSSYEYLNFLFSAKDFNDALKRFQYLKSYREYRETQAQAIAKTQELLQQGISDLNNSKNEKNKVLKNQSQQLQVLEEDKKEKDKVLKDLKNKESDVAAEIRKRERKQRDLRNAIAAAIRRIEEENRRLAKLREAEKNKAAAAETKSTIPKSSGAKETKTGVVTKGVSGSYDKLTSFESEMSINFENNKHNLLWPVSGGYVSHEFGTQTVPGTNLKEHNDGIYIATPVGSSVKCVADGEVVNIYDMADGGMAVFVQHGNYLTIYSNLSTVTVNKGDKVKGGTLLGKAAVNLEGNGEIIFEILKGRNYEDPRSWLKVR